ncbi:MAG: hypothetical protein ABSF35_24105 [Polyangia bacterium]|jgi:hypothetical protein
MRHLADLARPVSRAPLAVPMRALLEARKVALEGEIKNRHQQARATGTTANVSTYSAALRCVRRQLATLDKRAGLTRQEAPPVKGAA